MRLFGRKTLFALLSCLVFVGCAQTTFYRNGQRVAHFQGDMRGMTFRASPDGTIEWTAVDVNHSAATLAQGKAASDKISAAGAAIGAAGIMALFK